METQIDENLIFFYPSNVLSRWLAVRIEYIGTLVTFFASLFGVVFRNYMSPGYIGLIISYSLNVIKIHH